MLTRSNVVTATHLRDQCVFEEHLADRLRTANRGQRMRLYTEVYNEFAKAYPDHLPKDSTTAERIAGYESAFMRRFLTPSTVVMEVGPGRCHLAFAIAPLVAKIYGVDVAALDPWSPEIPPNFEVRLTDGLQMPLDSDSVDLAISNQLMEHLHPDDAAEQLREVYRVLRPGGRYICITPSRVNGPHDCSARFDDLPCPIQNGNYRAVGLHLKEYTTRELVGAFKQVGFRRVQTYVGLRGNYLAVPPSIITGIEAALRVIPPDKRKRSKLLGTILGNRLCATK